MIEQRNGDVLNVPEGIIVHGCNCLGVMGAGVALQVKSRFPEAFKAYRKQFESSYVFGVDPFMKKYHEYNGLNLGDIIAVQVGEKKWIINAMTQEKFGTDKRHVNYEAVATCFEKVSEFARSVLAEFYGRGDGTLDLQRAIDHPLQICFPAIGAGLAGGNWKIIANIIDNTVPDTFKKVLYVYT